MTTILGELKNQYDPEKKWLKCSDTLTPSSCKEAIEGKCEECTYQNWMDFLLCHYHKKHSHGYSGNDATDCEASCKQVYEKCCAKDTSLWGFLHNKTELKNLLKLYYFGQTCGDIQPILLDHQKPEYKKACQFVNECLHIFRELKEKYCPNKTFKVVTGKNGTPGNFSSSPVCYQLEQFFDKYQTTLYQSLEGKQKGNHNKMSSLEEHPDAARVRCDVSEDLYYTPFFKIFKYNSRRLTTFGSIVFVIFFILFMILMMHILFKFTPIGDAINPRRAHVRRKWRDIQGENYYPNSMGYYGDGSTYSDSSRFGESSTSDGISMSNEGSTFYYSAPDGSSMSNEGSTFYYSASDGSISSFGESNESEGSTTLDGSTTSDSRSTFNYSSYDDGPTSTDSSFSLSYRSARH
ncbi:hypothetical protein C922_05319 [Plasmodium inui San Antonio 1]|uniref:PIR Superfamily Protein n=1 Tax=Plasmodium inui San Antonio 1 TaxID=1237626 RepID=W7A5E5_9APIC|nr:hypothetical protein C922_05319 [Plasmodium inui San Antonio 1]EUD64304.1 hypothetical protein C922_05319 [Plasmodium inui San Antonio 1]